MPKSGMGGGGGHFLKLPKISQLPSDGIIMDIFFLSQAELVEFNTLVFQETH